MVLGPFGKGFRISRVLYGPIVRRRVLSRVDGIKGFHKGLTLSFPQYDKTLLQGLQEGILKGFRVCFRVWGEWM